MKKAFRISETELQNYKGSISYIHNGKAGKSPAYEISERARINISIPRTVGAYGARLRFFNEYAKDELFLIDGSFEDLKYGNDIYSFYIPIKKISPNLYYFAIEISSIFGIIYLDKNFGFSRSFAPYHQFSVSDFIFQEPSWHYGGIIYHIFVDRFYKSKAEKAPYKKQIDWNSPIPEYPEYPGAPVKNDYFYGGTLDGVIKKLKYIKSLGVTVIYLSPIFSSPSNHKYDTSDYMSVDEGFGGERALKSLIKKAKEYGISIILDGVFNHTGDDSLYFNKYSRFESVGAYQSTLSDFFPWYEFREHPDDYTSWWGIDILPRINPDLPECRSFFLDSGGVIDKYSKMGISGFRLDVADELSDSFIRGIKERLCQNNPASILYGEVWEDGSNKIAYEKRKKYFLGYELDGVMNYPIRRGLISFLRYGKTEELSYALSDIIYNAPKRIRDTQMNLLGSHDTVRILTALGATEPDGKTNEYLSSSIMDKEEYKRARTLLLLAYTVLATLPGIPSIYYGDEAGIEGYSDPFNRKPFPWGKEDKEILSHYRLIGRIRTENPVYKTGEYKLLYLSGDLLIFTRYDSSKSYVTFINNSSVAKSVRFKHKATELLSNEQNRHFVIKSKTSAIFKTSKDGYLELLN